MPALRRNSNTIVLSFPPPKKARTFGASLSGRIVIGLVSDEADGREAK